MKKVATQSTTYPAVYDYSAKNAVDRDKATCMRTDAISQTSPEQTVWWMVDLGGVYNIYSINILFLNYEKFGILLSIYSNIIRKEKHY